MGGRRRRLRRIARKLRVPAWGAVGVVLLTALPILALRWIDPPTTSFMLQSQLAARGREASIHRYEWVDAQHIAPSVKLAVVASEDQRFAEHSGFDVESIAEAVSERRRGVRRRGASTISQQLAKNLFLWPGKSLLRKGLEAWITAWIELLWPKHRILELYLNVAQFGDGIFGVEAASRAFFGVPARAVSPRQAALLAAVLPNPRRLHAARPSAYVSSRADWILDQMGYIDGQASERSGGARSEPKASGVP